MCITCQKNYLATKRYAASNENQRRKELNGKTKHKNLTKIKKNNKKEDKNPMRIKKILQTKRNNKILELGSTSKVKMGTPSNKNPRISTQNRVTGEF